MMDIVKYLRSVRSASDLLNPPPVHPPVPEQPWWSWEGVVEDELDLGLEQWAFGLAAFELESVVDAALAVLDRVVPILTLAVAAKSAGALSLESNVAAGHEPHPAEIQRWLAQWRAAPSREAAEKLLNDNQGDHLALLSHIGAPEFREYWRDTWMFAATAAYAAADLPGGEPARRPVELARVLLSGRRALAFEYPKDTGFAVWSLVTDAVVTAR